MSPVTKNVDEVIESTEKLGEIVRKSVEDENTQTPAMEFITTTQSLRDNLTLMKRRKKVFKFEEKSIGGMFWNVVFIQPLEDRELLLKMKIKL